MNLAPNGDPPPNSSNAQNSVDPAFGTGPLAEILKEEQEENELLHKVKLLTHVA